jgi:hypothetical protein
MKTSENITNLTKALFAFHGKVSSVKKTAKNPHFKSNYADLIKHIRQLILSCKSAAY